jgi:predicted dehydrogenase
LTSSVRQQKYVVAVTRRCPPRQPEGAQMADRIRAGIVGVGFMGTVHARAVRRAGGVARYTVVPAGHPQGYQDCFDAFVADTYAALAGETPDGLPTFADGLRAARITEAVLESSRSRSWVEVA